jgi:uncharacterized protein (DUF2236 family)
VSWRRASDARLNLAVLYPLLLQVAHPTIGAAVRDHSDFERQPWERLLRTIDYVTVLVYGGHEAARAGRQLRELHRRFKGVREDGERYSALEPKAYAWVHATLIEGYVSGHAQFGRPLCPDELERFYGEYRRLGRLIGVRERDLPPSWEGFREYFQRMLADELVRTETVDRVLQAVREVPAPPGTLPDLVWRVVRIPVRRAILLGGVGLLAPPVRRRLGIAWNRLDQSAFQALGEISRALDPVIPERIKVTGPAQLRARREQIRRGPLGDARALPPGSC